MKNLKLNQIKQIKEMTAYDSTRLNGRTKKVGNLLVADFKKVLEIKRQRSDFYATLKSVSKQSIFEKLRNEISYQKSVINTNYAKILIEGNSGIYLASPNHLHSDYNKTRFFDKNETTIKLMNLFNSILKN